MCSDTFILFQGQTNGIVQVYDNKGECNGSKDWQKETRPHHNEIWETSGYISYQPENKIIIWCFKGSKQIFLKTDTLNKACGILSVLLFKKNEIKYTIIGFVDPCLTLCQVSYIHDLLLQAWNRLSNLPYVSRTAGLIFNYFTFLMTFTFFFQNPDYLSIMEDIKMKNAWRISCVSAAHWQWIIPWGLLSLANSMLKDRYINFSFYSFPVYGLCGEGWQNQKEDSRGRWWSKHDWVSTSIS